MSKGNTFENDLVKLVFQGTGIANLADNAGTSPLTSLYLSLHTADPGEGGSQTSSECNYTSYARQAVSRDSGGFSISGNTVTLAAAVNFPNPGDSTNLSQTATHFAVGTASSGTGKILYSGAITPNIVISNTGVTPQLTTGTTITED